MQIRADLRKAVAAAVVSNDSLQHAWGVCGKCVGNGVMGLANVGRVDRHFLPFG